MNDTTQLLPFTPNQDQVHAIDLMMDFISQDNTEDFFILKGSAGTGKTSIAKAITDHLISNKVPTHIAAPTARAAKIIGDKTGLWSKTMHGQIYTPEPHKNGEGVRMIRKPNLQDSYTVFIVDESSMISDTLGASESFIAEKPLLTDYLDYVKQGNRNNKIIFIGDCYQLAPVNQDDSQFSPALDLDYIKTKFQLAGQEFELNQVMRQDSGSVILETATSIREYLKGNIDEPKIDINVTPSSTAAIHLYNSLYEHENLEKLCVITWSNKDANWWNNVIREQLGRRNTILVPGDVITTSKTWTDGYTWIHNGDIGIVREIEEGTEEHAGLHFKNASIEFTSTSGEKQIIRTKVICESLLSTYPKLNPDQEKALVAAAMKSNKKFRESLSPRDDEYVGAMRLRYGYAITCHKAQGGEWENILLHPYRPADDYRWLYTAITRAKQEVYSWAA